MPRVLLLLPTTTYRTDAFLTAAIRIGVDVAVASERTNTLAHLNPAALLTLDFKDPEKAARQAVEFSSLHKIDAVVPVDSQVVVVGAAISRRDLPSGNIRSMIPCSKSKRPSAKNRAFAQVLRMNRLHFLMAEVS